MKPKNLIIKPNNLALISPEFPQATNGVINAQACLDGIIFRINQYIGMKPGDVIRAFFGRTPSSPKVVPYRDPLPPINDISFAWNEFPNGLYDVWYTVEDTFHNIGTSPISKVQIINSPGNDFPAPIFPDAENGILFISSVIEQDGTNIGAFCNGMSFGDKVTFYWSGKTSEGVNLTDAFYQASTIEIKQKQIDINFVETQIPAQYILPLGGGGEGTGYYEVLKSGTSSPWPSQSLPAQVKLQYSDIDWVTINATQGAPVRNSVSLPYLNPSNTVSVFGRPGLSVTASVTENATINGTVITSTVVTLDVNGMGSFEVYMNQDNYKTTTVSIYSPFATEPLVTTEMVFSRYRIGAGGLDGYGFTTGAPTDGKTPCSVYMFAEVGARSIAVSVTGSALINGWTQSLNIPVHQDGTATLNIVNQYAETVRVTLCVPGRSADPLIFDIVFVSFPEVLKI